MPTNEKTNLAVSHLEDLIGHAGFEMVMNAVTAQLETRRKQLERAKGDKVAELQGAIEDLRWVLNLPKQLFDQAKSKKDPRTIE